MTSGFCLPLAVRSTIAYDTGIQHLLLLLSSPIDAVTSYFTFVVWRNDDFDVPAEEVVAFDRAIGEEDRQMLERLSGELPPGADSPGQCAGRQGLGRVAPPVFSDARSLTGGCRSDR